MLGRALLAAVAISYVICVLVLSGVQKGDLDVGLLRKLQSYNVNIDDLSNEKLRQECLLNTNDDVNKSVQQNEDKETDLNKRDIEILQSRNEQKKAGDNLVRTQDLSNLEAVLKYVKDKLTTTTEVVTEVTQITKTKDESFTVDYMDKSARSLIEQSIDKLKNKNHALERALKYWQDILNTNNQFLTNGKANIYKSAVNTDMNNVQSYIQSLVPRENNKENFDSKGIMQINQILSESQHAQEVNDRMKKLSSDNVLQALNQFLKHNHIVPDGSDIVVNTKKAKLDEATTPHVELPYIFDDRKITTNHTIYDAKPTESSFLSTEGKYSANGAVEYENYVHLKTFTTNPYDPDIPKYKYNYYLRDASVQLQSTRTPDFYKTGSTKSSFKDTNTESKEMKLSKDVIRRIAETVKDIVLKDLKKELTTIETIKATSPTITQTTTSSATTNDYVTKSSTAAELSVQTTKIEYSPVIQTKNSKVLQQSNEMAKKMAKIVAILNGMEESNDRNPQDYEDFAKSLDKYTGGHHVRTYAHQNNYKFPPQFAELNTHPELRPMMQEQPVNLNLVPQHQRTPEEMRMGPVLIQTNLDQVPPLTIPLTKPHLMNINIVVPTESHSRQDKLNHVNEFSKLQRKSDTPVKMIENKTKIDHNDKIETTRNCAKRNNDGSLQNKTDEIMKRLQNIESLFSNLKDKDDSTKINTEKHAEKPINKVDHNFRESDTINFANDFEQREDNSKKIKYEIDEASLTQLYNREIGSQVTTNVKPMGNYLTRYRAQNAPNYQNLAAFGKPQLRYPNQKIMNTEKISEPTTNNDEMGVRLKNIEKDLNRLRQQIRPGPSIIDKQFMNNVQASRGVFGRFNKLEPQYFNAPYIIPRHAAYKQATRHDRARINPRQVPQRYKSLRFENRSQRNDILTRLKNMELSLYGSRNGGYGPVYQADPEEIKQYIPKKTNGVFLDSAPKKISYETKQDQSLITEAEQNPHRGVNTDDEGSNPNQEIVPWRTTNKKRNYIVAPKYNKDSENMTVIQENTKGFHKKLETADEMSDVKTQEQVFEDNVDATATKPTDPSNVQESKLKYDDANFNNFLNTQDKVNTMLEKILGNRTPDVEPTDVFDQVF